MGADTVIEKIGEKAAAESEAIRKDSHVKAQNLRNTILAEAGEKAAEIRRSAEEQAARLISAGKQQSNLEAKISYLNEKKLLLANLRGEIKKELTHYDTGKMTELLTKLAAENPVPGDVFVCVSQKDAELFRQGDLLSAWSAVATDKCGKPANYKLSEKHADIGGGLILQGTEYDVDLSFDTLLDTVFEEHEKEIADCLFASGS